MHSVTLPPSLRVIERGWLNCNQIVMLAPGENVLVDSGYCTHRERTLELLAGPAGLDGEPLERLVNTHCHSDQRADPFRFDDTIGAGESFEGGGFEWMAHAAPGHDMDALMFFEPANRVLVSGDALWENGMGFVWPQEGGNPYIEAARESLAKIEALAPAVVIPGHGAVFADAAGAVARVRAKLDAFERDPAKNARHVMKVMFVFSLLDRGRMAAEEVATYLEKVPCYRRLSEDFLGRPPRALASWLLEDLHRSGAIATIDGAVLPTAAA
jgi:glyoxylase-like metal-dependent hydrolase (beta-lactamase superfamily II)